MQQQQQQDSNVYLMPSRSTTIDRYRAAISITNSEHKVFEPQTIVAANTMKGGDMVVDSSSCPPVPCFFSGQYFPAHQPSFATIITQLTLYIEAFLEQHPDEADYSHTHSTWIVTYASGSNARETHINVYWDSVAADHVVEMSKVKGTGFCSPMKTLFDTIRQGIQRCVVPPAQTVNIVNTRVCVPHMEASVDLVQEQFEKGVKCILSMTRDHFYEPRLESAKSLCDLAQRVDEKLLSVRSVVEGIVSALNSLLRDEFEEIRRFAVTACELFAKIPDYRDPLSVMSSLPVLVSLLVHSCDDESQYLQIAQIRRRACAALCLIAESYCDRVCQCLKDLDVRSEASFTKCLVGDHRLMAKATPLGLCFAH